MRDVSLYWFAAQQKFDLFYLNCLAEFIELKLKFSKRQEVAKKSVKLKLSRKTHICGFQGLRVNHFSKL